MELGIKDKVAIVTGAGRGLGKGICESLDKQGVRIIAISRGKKSLDDLSKVLSPDRNHLFFSIDLEENNAINKVYDFVIKQGMSPDIIVNNAGGNLGFTNPLDTMSGWRKVMHLNVEVAIELNEKFLPIMIDKKWGRICHISSISALENQGPPSYCAAKAALNAYVRSAGRFVSKDNIIMTSVMPGAVLTEGGYWDDALKNRPGHVEKYLKERMAIQRFGKVEEVSELVVFLCSNLSSFCVGTSVMVDGGQGRVFYP